MTGVVCPQNLEAMGMSAEHEIDGSLTAALSAEDSVDIIQHIAQPLPDPQRVGLCPFGSLGHVGRVMQGQDPAAYTRIPMGCDQSIAQPCELLAIFRGVMVQSPLQIEPFLLQGLEIVH